MSTEEIAELRQLILEFKASVATDTEALHRHLDEVEAALINEVRAQGRRTNRLETRVSALESR